MTNSHNDPQTHLSDNGVERQGAVAAKNLNKYPDPDDRFNWKLVIKITSDYFTGKPKYRVPVLPNDEPWNDIADLSHDARVKAILNLEK